MTRKLWLIWSIALVVKLILSAWAPLAADEAYYWFWSHRVQLSYYDHPAMVAWLFWLGHPLEWLGQAVRWPAVIMGHFSILIWILILRRYCQEKQLTLFLWLALFAPLIGPGSMIVTPDIPLMFFWSCAIYCLIEALESQKTRWYVLLGLSLGLGFCSKYHIVIFVPVLFAYLAWQKKWSQVHWGKALLTVVVGLLSCFPVLYWNWTHDFASFTFQLKHGLEKKNWNPLWPAEYLLGQLLIICPLFLPVLWKTHKTGKADWLPFFALGPLAFFLITSFRAKVEGNWAIAAYPAILALALFTTYDRKWIDRTLKFWVASLIVLLSYMVYPWIPIAPSSWKIKEFYEYANLQEVAKTYQPLYASSYQMASKMSYSLKQPVYKLRGMTRVDFFDYLPESLPQSGIYYVLVNKGWTLDTYLTQEGHERTRRIILPGEYDVLEVKAP